MVTKTLYALSPSGEVKWKAVLDGKHNNSFPIVGADGTLYYTTEAVRQEDGGTVYALDEKNGNIKWKYKIKKGYIASPPTVDKNGLIYLGSGDGYLHCLTPDGNLKWKIKVGLDTPDLDQIYMSEPVLTGETIYIVSGPLAKWGRLVAIGQGKQRQRALSAMRRLFLFLSFNHRRFNGFLLIASRPGRTR